MFRVILFPKQWQFQRRRGAKGQAAGWLVSMTADFTGDTLWRRWHLIALWPKRKSGLLRERTRG